MSEDNNKIDSTKTQSSGQEKSTQSSQEISKQSQYNIETVLKSGDMFYSINESAGSKKK